MTDDEVVLARGSPSFSVKGMTTTRLANANESTFWAHHAWSEFAALPSKEHVLVVLPVHGFADHGLGMPLDVEETVTTEALRRAVGHLPASTGIRVLPPLRFALAPYPSTFFGIDPETAHDLVREIALCVKTSGFRKLVLLNSSPWNVEFIDAASRDARVELGLQSFVVNVSGLGLDLHPSSPNRVTFQALASRLLDRPPATSIRAGDVEEPDFRPGTWRQPAPVAFDPSIDGAERLRQASLHLARLLLEIDAKSPLGSPRSPKDTVVQSTPKPLSVGSRDEMESGRPWPDYRKHYLMALTRDELEDLPDKENAFVILPTGAIEQHGHHLPVGVDAIIGQAWLNAALPKLPPSVNVWVAPPITFGKSNEHVGFPGTITLSAKSLRRLVLASARQLHLLGFRNLGVLNTHGGNSAVLVYTIREIQSTLGMRAGIIGSNYPAPLSPQEREYGFHAGEWETSLMLASTENLVRMDRAVCEFPARLDDPGELRPENAPAIFSWISSDVSRSGAMGDATRASVDKGRLWMEEASSALAKRITHLATRGFST